MSQYFNFYLARKDAEGQLHYVAPYYDKDGQLVPYSLMQRSRSFIDWEEFVQISVGRCPVEIMDETLKKLSSYEGQSTAYLIPFNAMNLLRNKNNSGLYVGYVNPEDAEYIIQHHNCISDRWEVDLCDPEIVAEEGRGDRIKMAFWATNDPSYQSDILVRSVDEILPWDEHELANYYFVFDTEY